MIKIQTISRYLLHAKILPILIVILSVFVGIFSYILATGETAPQTVHIPEQQVAGASIQITLTPTSSTHSTGSGSTTITPTVLPTLTLLPTNKTAINQTSNTSITEQTHENTSVKVVIPTVTSISIPTVTVSPISTTPTPSLNTAQSVTLQIISATTNATFSIELNSGATVCDVLQKAKDEGRIQSLTFNDAYLSAYHSRYVTEINGLANNWTFTVNGTSPLGCSLSIPRNHDVIVWKYS